MGVRTLLILLLILLGACVRDFLSKYISVLMHSGFRMPSQSGRGNRDGTADYGTYNHELPACANTAAKTFGFILASTREKQKREKSECHIKSTDSTLRRNCRTIGYLSARTLFIYNHLLKLKLFYAVIENLRI